MRHLIVVTKPFEKNVVEAVVEAPEGMEVGEAERLVTLAFRKNERGEAEEKLEKKGFNAHPHWSAIAVV